MAGENVSDEKQLTEEDLDEAEMAGGTYGERSAREIRSLRARLDRACESCQEPMPDAAICPLCWAGTQRDMEQAETRVKELEAIQNPQVELVKMYSMEEIETSFRGENLRVLREIITSLTKERDLARAECAELKKRLKDAGL